MYLKNSKLIAFAVVLIWAFMFLGASACMAQGDRACCRVQKIDCPIISSVHEADWVQPINLVFSEHVNVSTTNYVHFNAPHHHDHHHFLDFVPPNYIYLAKISHPPTAPPQA
jgi:hypothetical protein